MLGRSALVFVLGFALALAPRRSETVDLHTPAVEQAMERIHSAALRAHISFPADDLLEAAARLTRVLFLIGFGVVQDDDRPRWNPGDFYGEHAK